jgi:hypothetical protein
MSTLVLIRASQIRKPLAPVSVPLPNTQPSFLQRFLLALMRALAAPHV